MANMQFAINTGKRPNVRADRHPSGGMELLVQASEMLQAVREMNQAMETYQDAVETTKAAAADLAGKWEGAAKDAFVKHQENAHNWHCQIIGVVGQMISTIRQVVELYDRMEDAIKDIVRD